MSSTGKKLTLLRTQKGITLDKLSSELGINKASLSRMENDKILPSVIQARLLANYYNISLDDLLNEDIDIEIGLTKS